VAHIIEVDDLAAPELAPYTDTAELGLKAAGIFVAESPKVIRTALDAGFEAVSLLAEKKYVSGQAADIIARLGDVPVYTADREQLTKITGFKLTQGVLCAMKRPRPRNVPEVIAGKRRVALLEGITEPSNVGAIFRSAAALKADAILLSPSCCDPLHRRAVRVCMGAIFQVPWARAEGNEALPLLKEAGFTVIGLALRENCWTLDDPRLPGIPRMAVCLGTEDTGLTEATLDACDHIVKIPMAGGIDSLNVAAAAAVAFWQLRVRE
jgi:tRNA G18 (ribose-2'-O)-methylase SpoU